MEFNKGTFYSVLNSVSLGFFLLLHELCLISNFIIVGHIMMCKDCMDCMYKDCNYIMVIKMISTKVTKVVMVITSFFIVFYEPFLHKESHFLWNKLKVDLACL